MNLEAASVKRFLILLAAGAVAGVLIYAYNKYLAPTLSSATGVSATVTGG